MNCAVFAHDDTDTRVRWCEGEFLYAPFCLVCLRLITCSSGHLVTINDTGEESLTARSATPVFTSTRALPSDVLVS